MPPKYPDQRQGLRNGVWRLMAALLRACGVAADSARQASPVWFSAVADVTENLLTELHGTGSDADGASSAVSAPEAAPSQPEAQGNRLRGALNSATSKLEELEIQGHVAWTKRRTRRSDKGGAGAPSSSAADVEALMVRAIRILARCMELQLLCPNDSPSGCHKAKMCAAVLQVVSRCTIAVEFRRSISALQRGAFKIKLGSSAADATFLVKLDAIWPSPSDLQRSCFSLRKNPGTLQCFKLRVAILGDNKRALAQQSHYHLNLCSSTVDHATITKLLGRSSIIYGSTYQYSDSYAVDGRDTSSQKGIINLRKVLQEWVSKELHHECAQQITHSNIYGRDDTEEGITNRLLSNDTGSKFTVICLAAKRGFGKTTLVRSVYNNQIVSDAFDMRLWICLPEMCDEKVILRSIIEHATQVQCDVIELKLLRELAKDELNGRKLLLVLEDCLIRDCFCRIIHGIMKFSGERSAIIVTSKNEDVRYPRGFPVHVYKLSTLRDEHCLQILQQFSCDNLGPGRDHGSTRIISHIISNCGSNPLYLKAACGLLWHAESALQQLNNLEDALVPNLKLCYDLLPQHLKLCLSFCSLFPIDYLFTRHHLIRQWMSLGFVNLDELERPEEIGTRYFEELLCRSFFEHSSSHENKEDKFVVPKSFHDMVTSISKDICLRSKDLLCRIPEKICRLSLVPLDRRTVVELHPITKQVENLDAFLVVNRSELQNNDTSLPFLKLQGLNDFLLKFHSLRTLNLSYTVIGHLPASIGNLKNLQYLAVNNTDIGKLPHELCLLKNLQTLEVQNCPQLVTLPDDTSNLTKLRHLDVRKQTGYVRMPLGVGELIHLQTLPVFNVGRDLYDCSIRELRNLDDLHGDLTITGLENVKVGNDAREAKLINKKYLQTLTLQWSDNNIYLEDEDEENSADVFESLQPPNDLENLIVQNYSGSLFPFWIEKSPYENLESITLDGCYNCCMLPDLGDLQTLRNLCLRRMYALRTFGYTSLSEERSGGKFPALELLKLWEMYELEGWIGVKDGDFPRLHNISICGCPVLKSMPRLPSLVDLSLHRCNQLPEIPKLVKLKWLRIEGFQDVVSLDLPQGLPALKNLEIIRCSKLVSLVGLSTLSSVERLKIVKCPNLEVVNSWQQYHFKNVTTSRDATIIST